MNDEKIIELCFARSEDAITETDRKYGESCRKTAYNILGSHEDSEECTNDTFESARDSHGCKASRLDRVGRSRKILRRCDK